MLAALKKGLSLAEAREAGDIAAGLKPPKGALVPTISPEPATLQENVLPGANASPLSPQRSYEGGTLRPWTRMLSQQDGWHGLQEAPAVSGADSMPKPGIVGLGHPVGQVLQTAPSSRGSGGVTAYGLPVGQPPFGMQPGYPAAPGWGPFMYNGHFGPMPPAVPGWGAGHPYGAPALPALPAPPGQGNPPAYVQELQATIHALREVLEGKLGPSQPADQGAAGAEQQPGVALLPQNLRQDEELRALALSHAREMAVLGLEVDKARTATQLQELNNRLKELQFRAGQLEQGKGLRSAAAAESEDESVDEEAAAKERAQARELERLRREAERAEVEKLRRLEIRRRQQALQELREKSEDDESEDESEESYEAEEDRRGRRRRGAFVARQKRQQEDSESEAEGSVATTVVEEAYQVRDLWVTVGTLGPLVTRGAYAVAAVAYDGQEPIQPAGPGAVTSRMTHFKDVGTGEEDGLVVFREQLQLTGLRLRSGVLIVLEVHFLRPAAGKDPKDSAPKDEIVAWAAASVLQRGEIAKWSQSLPCYRVPLMMAAKRKFRFDKCFIDFVFAEEAADPDKPELLIPAPPPPEPGAPGEEAPPRVPEDVRGVPQAAWLKVARPAPPAQLYRPGEGFVLCVDGARMLPSNVSISKVVVSVWSADRQQLAGPFQSLCKLDCDCLNPMYNLQVTLDLAGEAKIEDPTATFLLQVDTLERDVGELRTVGYAVLHAFHDPRTGAQPSRRNTTEYNLNAGAWQVPLHIAAPPAEGPFCADSLGPVPRVPCSSLLLRILTLAEARALKGAAAPAFQDRVYDSTRDFPTVAERAVYPVVLDRQPTPVRPVAESLAPKKQPPPAKKLEATGKRGSQKPPAVEAPEPPPAPPSDAELVEIMRARLARPELWNDTSLNYTRGFTYVPALGFHVAVDGANRLPRSLPTAAVFSLAPPGGFYQEVPSVDNVVVTLQYDMDAPLQAPVWFDGLRHFENLSYDPALSVIIDVRTVIPGSGTTAPVGWAILPVFEPATRYVLSGHYQLPLFQGVPPRSILDEMAATGAVEACIAAALKAGRLKYVTTMASVFVRLLDEQRMGQLPDPAYAPAAKPGLMSPKYIADAPKLLAEMRKEVRSGRTYDDARSKEIPAALWMREINDAIIFATGLDLPEEDEEDGAGTGRS